MALLIAIEACLLGAPGLQSQLDELDVKKREINLLRGRSDVLRLIVVLGLLAPHYIVNEVKIVLRLGLFEKRAHQSSIALSVHLLTFIGLPQMFLPLRALRASSASFSLL